MANMDIETCERVVQICRGTSWGQVLAWWKAQRLESKPIKEENYGNPE